MGGGLLTYPHAYMAGGIWNMVLLQSVFMPFIAVGLWVLAWCTERTGAETYQSMVKLTLGRRAEVFCVLVIVILVFGASVVYLDVLVDQVLPWLQEAALLCLHASPGEAGLACTVTALHLDDRRVLTVVMAGLLSLLCLGRSMASLSIPSLLGFLALIYVSLMIVTNGAMAAEAGDLSMAGPAEPGSTPVAWWRSGAQQWMSMIPVICFSYQGHISAVPLYAELHCRSTARWLKVIAIGLTACVVLYNAAGLTGYLQFSDQTQSDILTSFLLQPQALFLPGRCLMLARAAVAAAVCVTCAVFTFCARSALLDELAALTGSDSPRDVPVSNVVWLAVTYVWLGAVTAVAVCVPDISVVVGVAGNFSAFFMFHFPGLMLLAAAREDELQGARKLSERSLVRRKLSLRVLDSLPKIDSSKTAMALIGWTFIIVGTFVFVLGFSSALYAL